MPTDEKEKKDMERLMREANTFAQSFAISNFTYTPLSLQDMQNDYVVTADSEEIIDVDSKLSEDKVEEDVKEVEVEGDVKEDEAHLEDLVVAAEEPAPVSEEDEFISDVVATKFEAYLNTEKEQVNKDIEEIKKFYDDGYEDFVEAIKGTQYYQKRVEYWQNFYAGKMNEFKEDAKEAFKAAELEAKNEAASKQKAPEVVSSGPQAVQEIVNEATKKSVKRAAEGFKAKVSDLKLDPGLYKTIEQMLLRDLRAAFDEYRDYYKGEMSKLSETSTSKTSVAIREATGSRLELLNQLVNSFDEVFKITGGKRVYQFYPADSKKMKNDVESKKGSMDMDAVADSIMCNLYSYDSKTQQNTGMVVELAKYLTSKVQEGLIRKGKLGNFNIYGEHAEQALSEIIDKYDVSTRIDLHSENSLLIGNMYAELLRLNAKVAKDIKGGKATLSKESLDGFITHLGFVDYASSNYNAGLVSLMEDEAEKLKDVVGCIGTIDEASLLKSLEKQRKTLLEIEITITLLIKEPMKNLNQIVESNTMNDYWLTKCLLIWLTK